MIAVNFTNLALDQTTYQSSPDTSSNLAVDGIASSCAIISGSESNPWLVVDLGFPAIVYGVSLTAGDKGNGR